MCMPPTGTLELPRISFINSHNQSFDSVYFPNAGFFPNSLTATPDESMLYVNTRPSSGPFVLSLPGMTVLKSIPFPSGAITISPDGRLLACSESGLQIFSRNSLVEQYQIPYSTTGRFTRDGNWFVGAYLTDTSTVGFPVLKINTRT